VFFFVLFVIRRSWDREDDLAEGLVGFEASMSTLDLLEGKDRIDYWFDTSLRQ